MFYVTVSLYDNIISELDNLEIGYEFYKDGEYSENELNQLYEILISSVDDLEFKNMLSNEEDELGAIITINAGSGGTESQDWASMLARMYLMWAEKHNYKISVIDQQDGEVAGLKSISFEIEGDFCLWVFKI